MDRRRLGIILTASGVFLIAVASVLVYLLLVDADRVRASQPRRWVVVAAADIPERNLLTARQLTTVQLPDDAIPPGASVYAAEPGASDDRIEQGKRTAIAPLENQFTPQRIYAGEVINKDRLGEKAAKSAPAYEIPRGKVWYHFPVLLGGGNPPNSRLAVSILESVRAGDFVDIYYTTLEGFPTTGGVLNPTDELRRVYTRRILENIKVVNVGPFPVGTTTGGSSSTTAVAREDRWLTFEVTPDDALTLKWLKDAATLTGNLEVVLRSPQDAESTGPATIDYDQIQRRTGIGTGR
jgi:Flp pilus assembly protein CpaB